MKKRCSEVILRTILLTAIMLLCTGVNAEATSWIRLTPEEVDERAELIVFGQYDFSDSISTDQKYQYIFSPIVFQVGKYYRGSGAEQIMAGIDPFDMGWVKESQEGGASFLLFLERDRDHKDVLIPVAGPNGMVQIKEGKARTGDVDEEAYYNHVLENTAAVSPVSNLQSELIVFLVLFLISGVFSATRKWKGRTEIKKL